MRLRYSSEILACRSRRIELIRREIESSLKMCHHIRIKEIEGIKYVQYLSMFGELEFEHPFEPVAEKKVEEPVPLIRARNRRRA